MILWINGAFGSGKTCIADALNQAISHSFVYDPEQAGYFIWDNSPDEMKRNGNFQHIQIWREINYLILKYLHDNFLGTLIVPMTIYIRQYYDEIIGKLTAEGILVHHYILSAEKQTIIERLKQRGETEQGWAAQHIDKCITAFETDIADTKIHTDHKTVDEIVYEIIENSNCVIDSHKPRGQKQ